MPRCFLFSFKRCVVCIFPFCYVGDFLFGTISFLREALKRKRLVLLFISSTPPSPSSLVKYYQRNLLLRLTLLAQRLSSLNQFERFESEAATRVIFFQKLLRTSSYPPIDRLRSPLPSRLTSTSTSRRFCP
ncbi:unnamed protein product [Cochlearia groenlandica]